MFKEFKAFVMKGNVLDMAVGIVIGIAFGAVIKSLVDDILMPPIGLALGGVDFSNLFLALKEGKTAGPYVALADAKAVGAVTINYGMFVNTVISFLIVAFALFLIVKVVNSMRRQEAEAPAPVEPTTKACPYCVSTISIKATRCPSCTSQLDVA